MEKGAGEPEETKQIVDKTSGVSMNLPTDAPEGLSLKVSKSNGSEEKEAVSKLVQVEGDSSSVYGRQRKWNNYFRDRSFQSFCIG